MDSQPPISAVRTGLVHGSSPCLYRYRLAVVRIEKLEFSPLKPSV